MRNKLIQNSAKLLSANVFAQALGLAVYPILTRLYSPEDFGSLNVFLSIGGIITLISTAELQYAIVLPKTDEKAWNVLQCGLVVLVICSLFCLWRPLLAVYVFVMGLWTLMNYWYTRQQQFGNISRYQIGQSICSAGIKTGMAYTPWSNGLILGTVFAPLLSLLANWFYSGRQSIGERWRTPLRKDELKAAIQDYKNFPCYNLPRSLVGNLGNNLPSILLAPVFGLTELGFFGMALTLAFRPINMISSSIYQVLYQRFTELYNNHQSLRATYFTYIRRAAFIAIPGFLVLWFILPALTEILLGAGWSLTATYIRWMLPWLVCSLLVAPICSLCDVFGEQKKGFLFEILLSVARLSGIGIGILSHNFLYSVIGYSLGNTLVIFLQLIWYTHLVSRHHDSLR